MSGGAFNYEEHHLDMLVDEMRRALPNAQEYAPLLLGEMIDCIHQLELLHIKIHHIDYALSGDTSQEDYLERLNKGFLEYYDEHSSIDLDKLNEPDTDI
jgi:hypothetical protein